MPDDRNIATLIHDAQQTLNEILRGPRDPLTKKTTFGSAKDTETALLKVKTDLESALADVDEAIAKVQASGAV